MLEVRELSFAYDRPVLDGVTATVRENRLHALFGPNGTGKTTLYRCILALLRPATGRVLLDGRDTATMRRHELARRIAYVPQEHRPPFPYLVREVVLMGRTPHLGGVFGPSRRDRELAWDTLVTVGVEALADRSYTSLSGGQRQLVLLARALAQNADVLLLDEPTASLDFGNQLLVWRTVRHLTTLGKTALICTHDPNHVLWFCDEVLVLGRDGRLAGDGRPTEVITTGLVEELYGPVAELHPVGDRTVALPVDTGQPANGSPIPAPGSSSVESGPPPQHEPPRSSPADPSVSARQR